MSLLLSLGMFWIGGDLCFSVLYIDGPPYGTVAICADMSLNREWIDL